MLISSANFEEETHKGVWDTFRRLITLYFYASPKNFPGIDLLGVPPCECKNWSLSITFSTARLCFTRLFGILLRVLFGHQAEVNLLQMLDSLNS